MNALPSSLPRDLRVLSIDDEEVDRMKVRRLLRHQSMGFVEASTGAEALDVVEAADEIGCVLVDYFLPDVEAGALIPQLLERRPHLAVVALTGLGDEEIAVALMKAGARDYLNKDSLDEGRLSASIRSAVAQAAADARAAEFAALSLRHAERLEQLMEAAQHLVGQLDLRELATRGAAAARGARGHIGAGASARRQRRRQHPRRRRHRRCQANVVVVDGDAGAW
jgi:FixJ family two-component response regulator